MCACVNAARADPGREVWCDDGGACRNGQVVHLACAVRREVPGGIRHGRSHSGTYRPEPQVHLDGGNATHSQDGVACLCKAPRNVVAESRSGDDVELTNCDKQEGTKRRDKEKGKWQYGKGFDTETP